MRIQNHHTFLSAYARFNGSNHFAKLTGMEAANLERGFAENAQNLTTFPDGTVVVCRALDKILAGAKGGNTGGICIVHLENVDTGQDQMTTAQRDYAVQLNALLCRKVSLTSSTDTISSTITGTT